MTIGLSGFRTPNVGPVNSSVGVLAYEGDFGTTGDGASIRNGAGGFTALSNAANPVNNLFNSSISFNGVNGTQRFPDYVNNLGFDADVFALPGVLGNNQTSTEIRLTTSGDAYQTGAVSITTDLYAPKIEAQKTVDADVADVSQVLTYTIPVQNTGQDEATGVVFTDAIPANTSYVPGSLRIGGVLQTDGPGDDHGEVTGGQVTARLGVGATATAGGTLPAAPSPTVPVTFQVRVNPTVPAGTVVGNVGRVGFASIVTGPTSVDTAPAQTRIRAPAVDLEVAKDVVGEPANAPGYGPFETIRYRITVTNNGSLPAPSSVLDDVPQAPLEITVLTPSQGTCAGTSCALGTIGPGASATVDVEADVPLGGLDTFPSKQRLQNTAQVFSGGTETVPGNNSATAEIDTAPRPACSARSRPGPRARSPSRCGPRAAGR